MSTEQTALAADQTPISDDLVKTAAEHMHEVEQTYFGPSTYAPRIAQMLARAALEAAYPAIRQQVAQEIAAKAHELGEMYQATAVTHLDISIETGRNTSNGQSHMRTAHAYRNKADGAWAVAHATREIGGVA
jgi:ketosteroid isomerase-like protein